MSTVTVEQRQVLQWTPATSTITGPGIYSSLPDDLYHSDPVTGGSLSSSGARKLLPPSCPALFDYEKAHPPAPTAVFNFGHAAHKMVLGIGPEIVVVEADSWRTNAAKAARDEAFARGAVPLLPDPYKTVIAMADAIRAHPIATSLFREGEGVAEASLFWEDGPTGVMRRSRLDWLPHPGGRRTIIADYKSALSAEPGKFARAAMDYGYHQQADWYRDGVIAHGDPDPAFVFVVQEKTPPYLVSVVELDIVALRIGRLLNRRAIDLYAECTRTGRWPGYSDDVELVSLPGWYENSFAEEL